MTTLAETWLDICADEPGGCETVLTHPSERCQHDQRYIVDIYSPGSHNWRLLRVCAVCADTIRRRSFRYRIMTTIPDELRWADPAQEQQT
jgi:hypothetical protein